jgi:hypothetical protein
LKSAWLLLFAGACVGVLGLDDFQEAVVELCTCDEQLPQFDQSCVDTLTERLQAVSEPTRAEWLSFYADNCAGSCADALDCYLQDATCSQTDCNEARECCGFTETDANKVICDRPDPSVPGQCAVLP